MGVNISGIVSGESRKLEDFKGRTIGIDAYNALYQFLSIIRQPDGTPLKDSHNRTTSHLSGILYRTGNLVEVGIKPVYVFDGEPHLLKISTIEDRREIREQAAEEWKIALETGDIETARIKAQQSSRLTSEMLENSKKLLDYLGIPHVQAPSEGESQASYMASKGDVWACASQDFDCLLFGVPYLIRNLAITGKRKLPRKQIYVNVRPEVVVLSSVLSELDITREQLVDLGILVGTDFNEGIKGIGPKKGLKLVRGYGSIEEIIRVKNYELRNIEEIREIFLEPDVTDDYALKWRTPDVDKVKNLLCDEHDFSESRVDGALAKFRSAVDVRTQRSLDGWF